MRVRAIDDEDFLGLASTRRDVTLVYSSVKGGSIQGGTIEASPYGLLLFEQDTSLELSVDNAAFGTLPPRLDLLQLAPKTLSFRARGSEQVTEVQVRYNKPTADVAWANADARQVRVALSGLEGVDVPTRVGPKLLLAQTDGTSVELPLRAGASNSEFFATLPSSAVDPFELDVVDARGRVLSSHRLGADTAPAGAPAPAAGPRPLGLVAPIVVASPALSMTWWAPSAFGAGAIGATASREDDSSRFQGHARAQGNVGDLGADALILSDGVGDAREPDRAAWLGLRWRAVQTDSGLELAPAARVGIPTSPGGAAPRAELAVAVAVRSNKLGLIANAGGRAALDDTRLGTIPEAQGFLLAGATWDFRHWLTGYALLDAHALARDSELAPRGGLSAGLEAGTAFIGSVGMRASPWEEDGGHFLGQLSIGVREQLP